MVEQGLKIVVGLLVGSLLLALIAIASFVVLGSLETTSTLATGQLQSQTDTFLTQNGSTVTASQTPANFNALTRRNFTWLAFDGTGDVVTTPYTQRKNVNHTYSIWINSSDSSGNVERTLIDDDTFALSIIGGTVKARVLNTTSSGFNITASGLANSVWRHIAVTYTNSTAPNVSLYIDGAIVNSTVIIGNFSASVVQVNISETGAISFNGSIDEFRIYNQSITAAQISDIFTSGRYQNSSLPLTNLREWFALNENTGTTAFDLGNDRNNGTIINAVYASTPVNFTLTQGTDFTRNNREIVIINYDISQTQVAANYLFSNTRNRVSEVSGNLSSGYVQFFNNIPTVFIILAAVVIIMTITIIIFAVNKIRSASENVPI